MTEDAAPSPRSSRRWLYLPFVLLAILAAAWSGAWAYAAQRVEAEITRGIERESGRGRTWSCPERSVAGYPFRIEVSCRNPAFARSDGTNGTIGGFRSVAQVYAPTHVITEFDGPLRITTAAGASIELRWALARASVRASTLALRRGSLEADSPQVTITFPGVEPVAASALRLELHLRDREDPAKPGTGDAAVMLVGATLPPLDALLRSQEPLTLEIDLALNRLDAIGRGDWRETAERWRLAGGTVDVQRFHVVKGAARIDVTGTLGLDGERRAEGRLDASLLGVDAALAQAGLIPRGIAGRIVSGLLGGQNRAPTSGAALPQPVRLPIELRDGSVTAGPFPTGVRLLPLY